MTDDSQLIDILRRHCRPLEPKPTGVAPQPRPLPDLRAVLFDLYGTLVISGSGEVGTTREAVSRTALEAALLEMGVPFEPPLDDAVELMQQRIVGQHRDLRSRGIDYPEIQVADVWRWVVGELLAAGRLPAATEEQVDRLDYRRLAVEYEARANPCWPMPGLRACLWRLTASGLRLGIVSNAQFYTPLLFPALLDRTLWECGFERSLCVFSFEHGVAKPGTALYGLAVEALADAGIGPGQTLYVGNDMLNDIMPAAAIGLRTALFAGDARSLRWRGDDARVSGVSADLILTDLAELPV